MSTGYELGVNLYKEATITKEADNIENLPCGVSIRAAFEQTEYRKGKDKIPHIHIYNSAGQKVASVSIPIFPGHEPVFIQGEDTLTRKQKKAVIAWLKIPANAQKALFIYNGKNAMGA
jgi:hypothetical protein